MKHTALALSIGTVLASLPLVALAQTPKDEPTVHLGTLIVTTNPYAQAIGTQKITADKMAIQPNGNGNLTDLLRYNPAVRFANNTNNSTMAGELEPAQLSFYGQKYYGNNYMIDGLSNNNNLDPASNNGVANSNPVGYNPWDLPAGGEQSLWIDSSVVGQLEVFDSNISAKYGDFTGGVINAKIKAPSTKHASGSVSYKTTKDDWAEFHTDASIADDFESASKLYYQPQFTKNFYTLTLNQPINDKSALLFSYGRKQSTIPYYHQNMQAWTDQKRLNETYLLKGIYYANNGDKWSATAFYAPHSSRFYRADVKDGGYENQGGGYRVNIDWSKSLSRASVETTLGYQKDENTIKNDANTYYPWWHKYRNTPSASIDWRTGALTTQGNQTALYGGYGTYSTTKQSLSIGQDYRFDLLDFLNSTHELSAGWQYAHQKSAYNRPQDTYAYTGNSTWDTTVVCNGADACLDNEQYLRNRILYPAREVAVNYDKYALYLEDKININRLELGTGVRLSYDNLTKNTTVAPRFSFTLDAFGNGNTRIFGGANRYYGGQLLAYHLRNGIGTRATGQTRTYNQGVFSDWSAGTVGELSSAKYAGHSDLKTPYRDELNIGVSQKLANSLWTLKWNHSKGKDQLTRANNPNANGERILSNDGWSKNDSVTLTVDAIKKHHWKDIDVLWGVSAGWQDNYSNSSETYYDETEQDLNRVIFDDKLQYRQDLPAFNFNRPITASANMQMFFPHSHITWGHELSYKSAYEGYKTSPYTCAGQAVCGDYAGNATLYTKTKFKPSVMYNWRFGYELPIARSQKLGLGLEVNNVFNSKSATTMNNAGVTSYEMGRNFWLSANYSW